MFIFITLTILIRNDVIFKEKHSHFIIAGLLYVNIDIRIYFITFYPALECYAGHCRIRTLSLFVYISYDFTSCRSTIVLHQRPRIHNQ